MNDMRKTKAALIDEIALLRQKVAALEALEESERKFRDLAESTTAQICIIQDDRYVYANQAFLDYYMLEPEDLSRVSPDDLMIGVMSKETIERAMKIWQRAQERGDTRISFEFQDTDGNWFQTNVTVMSLGGRPAYMNMEFDITDHKRAEEALKESEKKFRALAESTSAQIIIIQGDRFIYANKAALEHYDMTWETLSSRSPGEMFIGEGDCIADCEAFADEQIRKGGGKWRSVFSETDKDGVERWFEMHVSRLELDGVPSWIATAFDITELKRAQNEMYRADKMAALGQIVAGVAHEINNPNNFIYFNLPILRRYIEAVEPILAKGLKGEQNRKILGMSREAFLEDVYKLLENMEHGSARITSIVSDLKNYVRNDENQDRKAEKVETVMARVMTLIGKQVRKTVSRLDVEISDDLPSVEMNIGKIEQVLINLLINARDAADKKDSWVKISARPAENTEGWIMVRVEDNGMGIPEENLDRIFEPFFTSKGREQGTGLGLSISHRIIEEHGGKLSVESKVGEGTCFSILLPSVDIH